MLLEILIYILLAALSPIDEDGGILDSLSIVFYVIRMLILIFNKILMFGYSGEIRNKLCYIPCIVGWITGNALGSV